MSSPIDDRSGRRPAPRAGSRDDLAAVVAVDERDPAVPATAASPSGRDREAGQAAVGDRRRDRGRCACRRIAGGASRTDRRPRRRWRSSAGGLDRRLVDAGERRRSWPPRRRGSVIADGATTRPSAAAGRESASRRASSGARRGGAGEVDRDARPTHRRRDHSGAVVADPQLLRSRLVQRGRTGRRVRAEVRRPQLVELLGRVDRRRCRRSQPMTTRGCRRVEGQRLAPGTAIRRDQVTGGEVVDPDLVAARRRRTGRRPGRRAGSSSQRGSTRTADRPARRGRSWR